MLTWSNLLKYTLCKSSTVQANELLLGIIDLVELFLWFLKSKDFVCPMCLVLGVLQSNLSIWLKYELYLMYKAVTKRSNRYLLIEWLYENHGRNSAAVFCDNRSNEALLSGRFRHHEQRTDFMCGLLRPLSTECVLRGSHPKKWGYEPLCLGFSGFVNPYPH